MHVLERYCEGSGRGGGGLRKPRGERKRMGNTEEDAMSRAAATGSAQITTHVLG
jgi:hypothetical protein